MKILRGGLDLGAFFERLSTASERLLLLDYDGTLAPFTVGREKAFPYPGVPELLDRIIAGDRTKLAIISGRAIADLIPLMGLARLPEIWGCHGWERRTADGAYLPPDLTDALKRGLAEAVEWAEDAGLGDRMERKPASVAMHWRGMPEGQIEGLRQRILSCWEGIAQESGFEIRAFDGGIELRPPGRDKGSAVAAILAESGEDAMAAYLGDDLTDEDAFKALAGRGLGVLVNVKRRPTAADVWIEPPDELMDFLKSWDAACGGADDRQ